MAIAVVLEDSGAVTVTEGTTTLVTGSFTVPSGAVLYVWFSLATSGASTSESWGTPSGLGGTWTPIHAGAWGGRRASALFQGTGCSGTGTVSVTYTGTGGSSVNAHGRAVASATDLDGTTPHDGAVEAVTAGASALNPTVSGSGSAGDATLAFISMEANGALGEDAGWAELADFGEATGIRRIGVAWDSDADTTPSWTWSGTNAAYGVSLRLKAATGGTNFTVTPVDPLGITDSLTMTLSGAIIQVDPLGLTDDVQIVLDKIIDGLADPLGMTDSIELSLTSDIPISAVDPLGMTDTLELSLSTDQQFVDTLGLTDDVELVLDKVIDGTADPLGMTDSIVLSLTTDIFLDFVDTLGMTDELTTTREIAINAVDALGFTDSVSLQEVGDDTINVVDPLGLTDSIVLSLVGPSSGLDICVLIGPPTFVHGNGAPALVSRTAGATIIVDRSAGNVLVTRSATNVFRARTPGGPKTQARTPGSALTQDRSASVLLGHGNAGPNTLGCED